VARDAHQRQAQDQGRDDGDFIGLEDVCGHTGAVAHVVAHLIRDDRRIAGIILFQVFFDLADEVGADVSRLGIDTAADAHEQRQQRAAEAEAQQRIGRRLAEDDEDERAAQQAQAVGQHAGDSAGAVGDAQRVTEVPHGGGGDTQVALDGHAHAELADGQGEEGAQDESHRATDGNRDAGVVTEHLERLRGRFRNPDAAEQGKNENADERQDGPELLAQIGIRTVLDGGPDANHAFRALVLSHHVAEQQVGIHQADDRNHEHRVDSAALERSQIDFAHETP